MRKVPSYLRSSTGLTSTPRLSRPEGIPQEFLLRDFKEKRKFRMLSRKLTVFVTFVGVYVTTLLLDRNIAGRAIVRSIVYNELLGPGGESGIGFNDISSPDALWTWLSGSLIDTVYRSSSDDSSDDSRYMIASHTVIVGGFHLLQTRYKALNFSDPDNKGSRCYSQLEPLQNHTCLSNSLESEDPFGYSNGTVEDTLELEALEMFNFSVSNDSQAGYQTYFLRSSTAGVEERTKAAQMQAHRWLDAQTKHIEITMPLFNYNLQLWSIVQLMVDFDLAGGVTPTSTILIVNLEPYNFGVTSNVARAFLEGIFVAHIVYFILLELWDSCVLSGGSFRTYMARYGVLNNIGDWSNIFVNVAIMLWRYLSQNESTRLALLGLTSFDKYVEARGLFAWDEALLGLNLLNMLLMTARALKYFQVTNGGRRLMNSVYGAMPEVLSFLPIYFAVIIGYSFAGHMIYGLRYSEWATFPRAFFRVFELNFGLYDPGPIYDENGIFSAIFIYSSNVVFCILMLNVFMAIVMSTWDRLTEREADKASERAQYSNPLGVADLVFIILTKEDFFDTLIDAALDVVTLEDANVTREMFVKAWKDAEIGEEPNESSRNRVLDWYWDANALSRNTSAKSMNSSKDLIPKSKAVANAHIRPLSGAGGRSKTPPSLASIVDAPAAESQLDDEEDEDAQVITSPRELDADPLRAKGDKKKSYVSPWVVPPAGAKVAIAMPPPP